MSEQDVILTNSSLPDKPKIVEKKTGIQVIKGGQASDEGFIDAVIQSYANLVNSPVTLLTLATLIFMALAEINNSAGPIEVIERSLLTYIAQGNNPPLFLGIAKFLSVIISIIINYKVRIISVGFMWVPYSAKPSSNNFKISLFLTIVLIFRASDIVSDVILSQLYFIYTQLRNPKVRFIILTIAIVLFVFGITNLTEAVQQRKYISPGSGSTKPTPTKAA